MGGGQRKLEEQRRKVMKEILELEGVDGVTEFATSVDSPWRAGAALGAIAPDNVDRLLLPNILDQNKNSTAQFAAGFMRGKYQARGWSSVDQLNLLQWSPEQIGQLLASLPFTSETWERSTRLLGKDEVQYWTRASANPYEPKDGITLAIDRLIEYGRPLAAIECISRLLQDKLPIENAQAVRALLAAVSSAENVMTMDRYHVIEIIKTLQNDPSTNQEDLFKVEWAYLPLFETEETAAPKLLGQSMADNPDFFCDVIRTAFRSNKQGHPAKELNEQERSIATNAYRLLNEWQTPPGSQKSGSFDGDALKAWLNKVKASCAKSGHLEIALSMVGHVLTYSPADPTGLWIHRSVAEVLNEKDAGGIRSGFQVQLFNSRGLHWIDPTGKPERELAQKYRTRADEVEAGGYFRLAGTLRALAADYDQEANRNTSGDAAEE